MHHVVGFHDETGSLLFQEADAIISEMHPVTDDMMVNFNQCKIIACASTGYDYIDHANNNAASG